MNGNYPIQYACRETFLTVLKSKKGKEKKRSKSNLQSIRIDHLVAPTSFQPLDYQIYSIAQSFRHWVVKTILLSKGGLGLRPKIRSNLSVRGVPWILAGLTE